MMFVANLTVSSSDDMLDGRQLLFFARAQSSYSGTHEESEKMKCFYLDHNSTTNSPID